MSRKSSAGSQRRTFLSSLAAAHFQTILNVFNSLTMVADSITRPLCFSFSR